MNGEKLHRQMSFFIHLNSLNYESKTNFKK